MRDAGSLVSRVAQAPENGITSGELRRVLLRCGVLSDLFQKGRVVKHPLGFAQLQVGEFDGRAVRLHLWPRCGAVGAESTSDIHSHPWPLHSFVLAGSIINRRYDVSVSDPKAGELYEVRRVHDGVVHRKLDIGVDWRVQSSETVCAGDDYAVAVATFHSSTSTPIGAVTMVIAGERGELPARVVRPLGDPPIITRAPVLVGEAEKWEALRQVLSMLEHMHTPGR